MKRRIVLRKRKDRGFTLIELLMYIGLFSLIIGAIVGLAILATSQRQKNEAVTAVNYQGEAVMALITQTVHQATSITAPTAGTSSGSITLAMSSSSINPSVFTTYTTSGVTYLELSAGSPAVTNYLTNSRVTSSAVTFTNMSATGTKGSVLISFTLSYKTSSSLQEFNYQKTFYGAATIP